MKVVLQRVQKASVIVDKKIISSIGNGLVLMLGIHKDDALENIEVLVEKIIQLRVFESGESKFENSITEIQGEILVISQFTLFAETKKGRRPFFGQALNPIEAEKLYNQFILELKKKYNSEKVKSGEFGSKMTVEIYNDGPVTLILDTVEQ